jgi:hypothetical protein
MNTTTYVTNTAEVYFVWVSGIEGDKYHLDAAPVLMWELTLDSQGRTCAPQAVGGVGAFNTPDVLIGNVDEEPTLWAGPLTRDAGIEAVLVHLGRLADWDLSEARRLGATGGHSIVTATGELELGIPDHLTEATKAEIAEHRDAANDTLRLRRAVSRTRTDLGYSDRLAKLMHLPGA